MFEEIPGYKNRELTQDQYDLVNAIKEPKEETLYKSFQKYWKARCGNADYLSDFESWQVLYEYVCEIFEKNEYYHIKDAMRRAYFDGKSLSAKDMADIYLVAIRLIQMRYEIDLL